jgi:MFS family permease
MNKTLYVLWFSDIFILTGFGLATPILAIFITNNIVGGTILTAGIASALYMGVKAVVQIPFSKYVDCHEDKVKWLWVGTFLIATVPFQYLMAKNINAIYIAQAVYGIGAGIAASAWLSLWSTHLDKNHEGFEWSIYSATVGIGTGVAAFLGGVLATYFGFNTTIIAMGILSVMGFLVLLYLENKTHAERVDEMQYHKHHKLIHNSHHR